MTRRTHLIIPDAHATPEFNNDRFDWLGQFIIDTKPDVLVCIGDFADMPSLCSYDKGKRSFEGRRYLKDIEASKDAMNRLMRPLWAYNERQRKNSKKQYRPEMHLTLGNHCHRINRATDNDSMLDGTIGIKDLDYPRYGWKVYDFLTPAIVDGVAYCHYFTSGVMGRPIGGENPAAALIKKQFQSCVAGHLHLRDFSERTDTEGKRLQGLLVGCYLDEDQWEDYAGEANKMWWKGIVVLHEVENGEFEPEFINIRTLRERYGK